MLTCELDLPNDDVAEYVEAFLRFRSWERRRVETVSFIDYDTIRRRTTIDLSMKTISESSTACPFFVDRPLVPIALMKKDLLASFDLRDAAGGAISVVPRDVDAFFAWSILCRWARRGLSRTNAPVPQLILDHLKHIAYSFPKSDDVITSPVVASWIAPNSWSASMKIRWQRLLKNEQFERILRQFTFNYLLIAQLPALPEVQIVKFSFEECITLNAATKSELLGYDAAEFPIETPSIGWGRSFHLQVEPPTDMIITDMQLLKLEDIARSVKYPERYEIKIGNGFAQIHTTNELETANYTVSVLMRVSVSGYLRAAWISTMFAALILALGNVYLERLERAVQNRAEAAVALLLVVPSLVSAYLVRPGEHAIASKLLRYLRYGAGLCGLVTYFAAAALVLGWNGNVLSYIWRSAATLALWVAMIFSGAVILTKVDLVRVGKELGQTRVQHVIGIPEYET